MIGAEFFAERCALVGAGRGDHVRTDHVLGDLDADGAQIAAGAHDQHGLAVFQLGDVHEQIPRRRHVTHDHGGAMKVEMLRDGDAGHRRNGDQLGKAAGTLDAHHALRALIAAAVLGANVQRHDAGRGDAVARTPAADLRADSIDDTGAIDAGNERQYRAAILLAAGAQADVEHAIDGCRMDLDADLTLARDRVGKVFVAENVGRPVFVDDDRFHRCSCVLHR